MATMTGLALSSFVYRRRKLLLILLLIPLVLLGLLFLNALVLKYYPPDTPIHRMYAD